MKILKTLPYLPMLVLMLLLTPVDGPAAAAPFTVTATAGEGGAISPAGAVTVAAGGTKTFTMRPNAGYVVSAVSVTEDGTTRELGAVNTHTFNSLAADGAISVTFASSPLNSWRWRNPLPQGEALQRVIAAGSSFVAVGDAGAILTSADGISWTVRESGGAALRSVAFGNDKLVAVGNRGKILLSSDGGATWANRPSDTLLDLTGVTFGNGLFVAVGNTETDPDTLEPSILVLTSADGVTWTKRNQPLPLNDFFDLADVAFGGGTFIAVGQGGRIITSADGITWSAPATAGLTDFTGIAFGSDDAHSGTFVAVATAGEIVTSTNAGASWTQQPLFSFTDLRGVGFGVIPDPVFTGNQLPIFTATGDSGAIFVSEDFGESWSNQATGLEGGLKAIRGAAAAGVVVAVGDGGEILTSDDADIWTRRLNAVTVQNLRDIARGNRIYVAVGDGEGSSATAVVSSDDGASWNPAAVPTAQPLRGVTYGNGFFVAVGESGYSLDGDTSHRAPLLLSSDGLSWSALDSGTYLNLNGALYTGEAVHVLGDYDATGDIATEGALVLSSADGVNWSSARVVTTTAGNLRRGAYGDGVLVAVGDFGTILTSADGGETWAERTFDPYIGDFAAVAYGNGRFVAVLQGKTAYVSTDGGASWQPQDLPLETTLAAGLNAVTYGYGTFLAAGNDKFILSSPDGVAWTVRRGAEYVNGSLFGITSGNGTFVAVGTGGTILQSLPVVAPPQASVDPSVVAAGEVLVGTEGEPVVVTVTNSGDAPLEISSAILAGADAGEFVLLDGGCVGAVVAPGGGICTLAVVFHPGSVGDKSARVVIFTNDPDVPAAVVQLRGTAVGSGQVTVELLGAGSGAVTSSPEGLVVEGSAGAVASASFLAGSQVTLTAASTEDSVFTGWSGSDAGECSGQISPCTLTIAGSLSMAATFSTKQYAVVASAGRNGAIQGPAFAEHGGEPTYTIIPNPGFEVVDVLVNGVSQGPITSYTFSPITAPQTISATFALQRTLTITAFSGVGGFISPQGEVPVSRNGSQTFTFTPQPGYHVDKVIVDGRAVANKKSYTFSGIRKNRVISVSFALNSYVVSSAKAGKGTVTVDVAGRVLHGASKTYTFTPAPGYRVLDVLVNGVSVGAVSNYTLAGVTSAQKVRVIFSNTWSLTIASAMDGALRKVTAKNGGTKNVVFTPPAGFRIADVVIDGVSRGAITSFTFSNVSANHTVVVHYAPLAP